MTKEVQRSTSFAEWLEAAIRRNGWSQSEFSNRVAGGVSAHSKVSRYLLGDRIPDPKQCAVLAEALGVHLDEVLAAAGHRPLGSEPTVYEVFRVLRRQEQETARLADAMEQAARVMVPVVATIGTPPPGAEAEDTVSVLAESLQGSRDAFGVRVWMDLPQILVASGDVIVCDSTTQRLPRVGDLVVVRATPPHEREPRFVLARNRGAGRWEPLEATDGHALANVIEPVVVGTYVTLAPLGRR